MEISEERKFKYDATVSFRDGHMWYLYNESYPETSNLDGVFYDIYVKKADGSMEMVGSIDEETLKNSDFASCGEIKLSKRTVIQNSCFKNVDSFKIIADEEDDKGLVILECEFENIEEFCYFVPPIHPTEPDSVEEYSLFAPPTFHSGHIYHTKFHDYRETDFDKNVINRTKSKFVFMYTNIENSELAGNIQVIHHGEREDDCVLFRDVSVNSNNFYIAHYGSDIKIFSSEIYSVSDKNNSNGGIRISDDDDFCMLGVIIKGAEIATDGTINLKMTDVIDSTIIGNIESDNSKFSSSFVEKVKSNPNDCGKFKIKDSDFLECFIYSEKEKTFPERSTVHTSRYDRNIDIDEKFKEEIDEKAFSIKDQAVAQSYLILVRRKLFSKWIPSHKCAEFINRVCDDSENSHLNIPFSEEIDTFGGEKFDFSEGDRSAVSEEDFSPDFNDEEYMYSDFVYLDDTSLMCDIARLPMNSEDYIELKNKRANFKKFKKEHGFDPSECWNLDETVAKFAYPRLVKFKKDSIAIPYGMTKEEWDNILNKMIISFRILALDGTDSDEYNERYDEIKEGFELFGKHFTQLNF